MKSIERVLKLGWKKKTQLESINSKSIFVKHFKMRFLTFDFFLLLQQKIKVNQFDSIVLLHLLPKEKKLCSHCFLLQSAMCRPAKSWCVVTLLSPRKTLAEGLRARVYCSRGTPTRRSVGFWCRCGTKVQLIHCSASDQLDEERIDTSLGLSVCARASKNA